MARQARIEYPGAVHHVRSRGNDRQAVFLDDRDRIHFLALLAEAVRQYGWLLTAWVLMTNHFHLVLETHEPNLSRGMKWLLGTYVGWRDKRHRRTGHLFGDRFHSDRFEKQSYLTEAVRYIVLNPVRAKKIENQIYLGTEAWMKEVRKIVESKMRSDDHPRPQREVGRPKMAAIITAVGKAFGVTEAWIRSTHGNRPRRIAAWLGWYEGLQRLRAIAAALRGLLSNAGAPSGTVIPAGVTFTTSLPSPSVAIAAAGVGVIVKVIAWILFPVA